MSCKIQLVPELQQLIDDFVSVRQRFADLAEAYVAQQMQLQKQHSELENAMKQISAMRQKQTEDEVIVKSYNQLKIDYELMHSTTSNHRDEIYTANQERVRNLEDELKEARAKSSQQAELHQKSVVQIVADYEAKLQDADEKIRQLSRFRNDTLKDTADNTSIKRTRAPRRGNNRWPPLAVDITSKATASRGRGRARGGMSKRKLFKLETDVPIDVE